MATKSRLSDCGVSRRDMIRIGAGGLGFGLLGGIGPVPFVLNRASLEAAALQSGKILVVFEWFGGNDGLNTIVPYGDPMYYKHRPTIGIKERDLLKIDSQFGWHRSMRGIKQLLTTMARSRSFKASATTSRRFRISPRCRSGIRRRPTAATSTAGWDALRPHCDPSGTRANMVVNISDSQTLAVKGENHVPLVFIDPTRFQRGVFAQEKAALAALGAPHEPVGEAHKYVLEVTRSAAQASELVRAAWSQYRGKDNPDLRLLDLDKVAALIEADFPTKLYYVPLRNSLFDTHVNQASPHDRQLEYCADAVAGFFQELERIGRADEVVMYIHSEFGRRVPGKHQPRYRPRHGAGELRHRQRRKGRALRHAAESHRTSYSATTSKPQPTSVRYMPR